VRRSLQLPHSIGGAYAAANPGTAATLPALERWFMDKDGHIPVSGTTYRTVIVDTEMFNDGQKGAPSHCSACAHNTLLTRAPTTQAAAPPPPPRCSS
jgi:hypothetical protein